jgi:NAD(P) transhydrogenase subunit alpha
MAAETITTNDMIANLYVFALATFIGLEVIRRVSPLLHTPLMSLTNAISAIAVVGALVIAGRAETVLSAILGTVAVTASMVNVVGGYLITYRMVRMFKKRETKKS